MAIKMKKESSKLWETTRKISDVIDSLGLSYPDIKGIHSMDSPMDILLYDNLDIRKETEIREIDPNYLIPSEWNNLESRDSREIENEIRNLKKGKLPVICYKSDSDDIIVIEGIRRVYAAIHKQIEVTAIIIPESIYTKYKFDSLEWKWLILDSHSEVKVKQ